MLVPALNAERTLRRSLRSALRGTYENIELIVIDDGSEDRTAAIAEETICEDRRVRLHRKPRRGVAAALNSGLSLARGAYVARLDSDDLWHPSKLERQMSVAHQRPEAAFIYCFARYIDPAGRVVFDAEPQQFPERALARSHYESLIGGNSSTLIKRSAIEQVGGYDESLASWEDWLLQLQICSRHPLALVPEYLTGYRIRPGSLSADPRNMLQSWRQARRRAIELFPQVPPRVHAWAHGKRCALLAEAFAWRGRYRTAAALLAEAMEFDSRWTTYFLAFRAGRSARHLLSGSRVAAPLPMFAECRPEMNVAPLRSEIGANGGSLRRLEQDRVRQLAAIDDRIAQNSIRRLRSAAD